MKIDVEDIDYTKVKDKLLVITTDDISREQVRAFNEQVRARGGLGVVILPAGAVIESLGVKELELIVQNIKARTSQKDANVQSGK